MFDCDHLLSDAKAMIILHTLSIKIEVLYVMLYGMSLSIKLNDSF